MDTGTPGEVSFNSSASMNADEYSWDFGDGGTSIDPNPNHTYSMTGTYTVILTVSNTSGSDSMQQDVTPSFAV